MLGSGIAVDVSGAAYVTGNTGSVDFPTTGSAYDTTCGTDGLCNGLTFFRDVFVTKLAASGAGLVYSTYLGGSQHGSRQGYRRGHTGPSVCHGADDIG